MQAGCVGKCGDANVHLCGEPAPRPWRERCPVLAPFPSAGRGAGLEAGPGCPLGRGVWPCGPPSVWLRCSGVCAFPQCPGLASGSMPESTPGALPAVSVYGTPPSLTLLASAPASGVSAEPSQGCPS